MRGAPGDRGLLLGPNEAFKRSGCLPVGCHVPAACWVALQCAPDEAMILRRRRQLTTLMFKAISIRTQRPHDAEEPTVIGFLAEAMLFYGRVRVIAGPSMLKQLFRRIGPELLLQLCEEGFLQLVYLENGLGIKTVDGGTVRERHSAILYGAPAHGFLSFATRAIEDATGRRGHSRRLAARLERKTEAKLFTLGVAERAQEDFGLHWHVQRASSRILLEYAPGYLANHPDVYFRVEPSGNEFVVETDIDFAAVNAASGKVERVGTNITPAFILARLLELQGDLFFTADAESDLATDSLGADLLNFKIEAVIRASTKSQEELSLFQQSEFHNGSAVCDAINSGQRSFDELLPVLRRAEKFKKWLQERDADSRLLNEYYRESTADTWIHGLPGKMIRWSAFTSAGAAVDALVPTGIATYVGLGLSAGDAFLFDRLVGGWKPSAFVRGPLCKFTST